MTPAHAYRRTSAKSTRTVRKNSRNWVIPRSSTSNLSKDCHRSIRPTSRPMPGPTPKPRSKKTASSLLGNVPCTKPVAQRVKKKPIVSVRIRTNTVVDEKWRRSESGWNFGDLEPGSSRAGLALVRRGPSSRSGERSSESAVEGRPLPRKFLSTSVKFGFPSRIGLDGVAPTISSKWL